MHKQDYKLKTSWGRSWRRLCKNDWKGDFEELQNSMKTESRSIPWDYANWN